MSRTAAIAANVATAVAVPTTAASAHTGAYCGVVKSFNDQRGFGWLSCPAAGRDVFVHVNDLTRPEDRMLLPFAPNTVLQFDIAHRPRGLSAVNVTVVVAAPVQSTVVEAKEAVAARPRRPAGTFAAPVTRTPIPDVSPDERFRGTIVYYAATKGFGFVQSASLPSKVYLHVYSVEKYGAHELEIGMQVEFSVRENAKGKYAGAIKVLQPSADAANEYEECPYGIEMWPGRHRGTLRSYDPKRTLGWVSCGNTDVLMHIYELRQHDAEERLADGLVLEFSVGLHGRGPTAYDIDIVEPEVTTPVRPAARVTPLTASAIVQEMSLAMKSVHLRSPFAPVIPPSLKPLSTSSAASSSALLSHRPLVGAPYVPVDLRSPISPAGSTAPPSPVRSPSPSTRSSSPTSMAEHSGDEFGAIGDRRSPFSSTSPTSPNSAAALCDPSSNIWDAFQKSIAADAISTTDAYWGSVFKAFVNPWSTAL